MLKEQTSSTNQERNKWFGDFIAGIQTHQFMLDTNTASHELKDFYATVMEGDADKLAFQSKNLGQQHFVRGIVVDYISQILKLSKLPKKLAFDLADTEVLVWAETDDNDEKLEQQLILAEAKVNAKYHVFGYDITSMIVEKSDNLSIPSHYVIYKNNLQK